MNEKSSDLRGINGANRIENNGIGICKICGCNFSTVFSLTGNCLKCFYNNVKTDDLLPNQFAIKYCKTCMRYKHNGWITCKRDSLELLDICIRKLVSGNSVVVKEARFINGDQKTNRFRLLLVYTLPNKDTQLSATVDIVEKSTE